MARVERSGGRGAAGGRGGLAEPSLVRPLAPRNWSTGWSTLPFLDPPDEPFGALDEQPASGGRARQRSMVQTAVRMSPGAFLTNSVALGGVLPNRPATSCHPVRMTNVPLG